MPAQPVAPLVEADGTPWSWATCAARLQADGSARDRLTESILASGAPAVFWETVPSSSRHTGVAYAQMVLPSHDLQRATPDPRPFADYLDSDKSVIVFDNISGDTVLVAPTLQGESDHYPHLAAFLRGAPAAQVHALWATVAAEIEDWWQATDRPLWVSTSGLGVHWLHVRLCSKPKYYNHAPFRGAPGRPR